MTDVPGTKLAERLFMRAEGATMDEVIAATGGPQYNVLRRLEAKGCVVRKTREGRATRYHVIAAPRSSVRIAVSARGQLTLPKDLRETLGVASGGALHATVEDGCIVISGVSQGIADLFGVLRRPGMRPRSIEEIEEGTARGAVERTKRALRSKP